MKGQCSAKRLKKVEHIEDRITGLDKRLTLLEKDARTGLASLAQIEKATVINDAHYQQLTTALQLVNKTLDSRNELMQQFQSQQARREQETVETQKQHVKIAYQVDRRNIAILVFVVYLAGMSAFGQLASGDAIQAILTLLGAGVAGVYSQSKQRRD